MAQSYDFHAYVEAIHRSLHDLVVSDDFLSVGLDLHGPNERIPISKSLDIFINLSQSPKLPDELLLIPVY